MTTKFRMVGKLQAGKDGVTINSINSKFSNWEGSSLTLFLKSGTNNFRVKFFGGDMKDKRDASRYEDKNIRVYEDKEIKNEFKISYENRYNEEMLKEVPNFNKNIIAVNGTKDEYIFGNDFVETVKARFDELSQLTVVLTGDVGFSEQNGKIYQDFTVTNIWEAKKDEDGNYEREVARGTMQVFFKHGNGVEPFFNSKKKLDIQNLEDVGKVFNLDAFVEVRNTDRNTKDAYKTLHYPVKLTFNGTRLDFANPEHEVITDYMLGNFNVKDDGKVYKMAWDVSFVSGREEAVMSESDLSELLTDDERLFIERFPAKKEAFLRTKTGAKMLGEFKNEIRLLEPNVNQPFKVEAEDVNEDILEIYKTIKGEVPKASTPKAEPTPTTKASTSVVDALFG